MGHNEGSYGEMAKSLFVAVIIGYATVGCSSHPPEGTLVKPGWDVEDIPGAKDIPAEPMDMGLPKAVPISGGTLTIDGSTAVASDPDRDRVFIVDLDTRAVNEIVLTEGDEPGRSVVDAAGRAHVALRRGGAIVTIDLASRRMTDRRAVCPAPRGIAYDAATDALHVACDTGELVTLPAAGGAPLRVVNLGRDLRDVIVRPDSLVVTRFRSAEVLTIDAHGQIIRTKRPGDPPPTSTVSEGFEPMVAWRAVALSNGSIAVVHERGQSGEIAVEQPRAYYGGSDPCLGGIVHGTVSVIDPNADTTEVGRLRLPLVVGPSDIAVSPDGSELAVVATGNSWPVGGVSGASPGLGTHLPNVMTMPADGSGAIDECAPQGTSTEGEATAVAYDGTGRLVVQSREPAQLEIIGGEIIELSDDSRPNIGIELFHINSGAGVACASCHPEGRDDSHVWQFSGIGLRRTQTLSGGLLDTAPFHWSGDFEDLGALVHEVFVSRMAGPEPSDYQIEHFLDFLDRIQPPAVPVLDGAAVARGKALFEDPNVGCAGCHNGSHLTNNQSLDVGTGGVFQVPSLIGISARAPFMHDGCAPTLRDSIGPCGGTNHGSTSHLDGGQIDDLVAYLTSL